MMCAQRMDSNAPCGFDCERPESNGGYFGFMVKVPDIEK